ncbi:tyrosine-type recombinase/integrase [Halodesulfovibrio aestuarii]|uniref:Tyrosine-type recombinase/integrase n=1 Tax=Halodesulfovibrio aestuarii TaxID=126333 RepID=A0ABV4JW94_9BACT
MARKKAWVPLSGVKGIRYYEHEDRKYRGRPDRYYAVRWSRQGKVKEEGIGWASQGWVAADLITMRNQLQQNYKQGETPTTFKGLMEQREKKRRAAKAAEEEETLRAMTFRQFFEEHFIPWKRDRKKRRSWTDDVKRANHRILPFLGELPLNAITPELLHEFMDAMYEDGLSDGTVLHHMAVIRQTYNRAAVTTVDGNVVFTGLSPIASVELPKLSDNCNARERYLTKEEADLILRTCRKNSENAPRSTAKASWLDMHDAILLSLTTGLRMGEIQRLEWSDINFYGKTLVVRKSTSRKPGGTIPLNSSAMTMLKDRKTRKERAALVFPPVFGGKKRENFSHLFKDVVDSLGLNDDATSESQRIVFHSLRHTFASWLAIAGVDIYRIKSLMRHKTLAMTQRYAHLIPDDSREAVELLSVSND